MKTAVAFLIFNRPNQTRRVFAEIARAKPPKLLVVADGPRRDRAGEAERCAEARRVVAAVDWDCEVLTDFSAVNLGCQARVASGLDWVFSSVPEAIILEDDCVPHPDFFSYCETLLDRYREDERVMMISGVNAQGGRRRGDGSYFFARYCHAWGWATWRRAWAHFDVTMASLPAFVDAGGIGGIFSDPEMQRDWLEIFEMVRAGRIDSWAYPWTYAVWARDGLAAMPQVNLVTNIGFGPDATHTTNPDWPLANLPVAPLGPVTHPSRAAPDRDADIFTWRTERPPARPSLWRRAWSGVGGRAARRGQG